MLAVQIGFCEKSKVFATGAWLLYCTNSVNKVIAARTLAFLNKLDLILFAARELVLTKTSKVCGARFAVRTQHVQGL